MKYTQAVLEKNGLLQKKKNRYWQVKDEFIWYVNYEKKNSYIIVPEGFKTNFGSIPRGLWNIFPPTKYLAFVLHDYLYDKDAVIKCNGKDLEESLKSLDISFDTENGFIIKPNRQFADKMLLEALKVEGAGLIERYVIYGAVRIFGFLFYRK